MSQSLGLALQRSPTAGRKPIAQGVVAKPIAENEDHNEIERLRKAPVVEERARFGAVAKPIVVPQEAVVRSQSAVVRNVQVVVRSQQTVVTSQ